MNSLFLWLLLTGLAMAQSWPQTFQPNAQHGWNKALASDGKAHRYETRHFILEVPSPLEHTQLKTFTQIIESVPIILKKIPLSLLTPPRGSRARVRIFATDEDFIKAGGPIKAAGLYSGADRHVILRGKYFFSEEGKQRPDHDLLIHELTHLCMHENLWKYQPWFNEGVAEYMAAAHSHDGNYRFNQIHTTIKDHINLRNPPRQGMTTVTSMSKLVEFSGKDWVTQLQQLEPAEILSPYSASLLLIHYYFHGGPKRRKEVEDYLRALSTIKYRNQPIPRLVTAEHAQKIQTKLKRFWAPKGLRLQFR